jgi:aspartyl-tRNA(Asn)/glutamyl-tRNA(Gln) amidotransferase subunit C
MQINSETIDKIAHLARLNIEPSEKEEIAKNLGQILSWMEKLNELDTSSVEPLIHMSAELNGFRADKETEPMDPVQALKNAPSKDEFYFKVPKVIDLS